MSIDSIIRCLGINCLLIGYTVCAAIIHIAINSSKILKKLEDQSEIIRCKDCKHYDEERGTCAKHHEHGNAETWFCADGKEE